MKLAIPEKFDVATLAATPVKVSAKEKKRHANHLNSAMMFAKYGLAVMKIKAATLAALGDAAVESGVKAIGHGKVMVASENAEQAIDRVNKLIDELQQSGNASKHELIIDLMKLAAQFNEQLMHTAKVHLDADKQSLSSPGPQLTMPFPAGQPLLIAPMPAKHQDN